MKYFLGEAAKFDLRRTLRHLFAIGTPRDSAALRDFLATKYQPSSPDNVILSKNGRSALAALIKALVPRNSQIIVNGFTCQAVVEAVRAANCTPVYADINPATLHFDTKTLARTLKNYPSARAIIIQNTLGIPADAAEPSTSSGLPPLFTFARRHGLVVIEDLAHCAGRHYASGQEIGTLGAGIALSFGKGKAIDTISGGAAILRTLDGSIKAPSRAPKLADSLRARFYPVFAGIARLLTPSKLAKIWLGGLVKIHFIERSADARLSLDEKMPHWQAKLALKQFLRTPDKPLRHFKLVKNRPELLEKLAKNGYYFDETWYDCPISPQRNYQKWRFPESECPIATKISQEIINLPTFYPKNAMKPAAKIIKEYEL